MVVQLNDGALSEMMKKQALEEVAQKIDVYFIEKNITITKFRTARTLPSGDIAIQTTKKEETETLRGKDSWTRILESKAKLARKRYRIVSLEILISKIDLEKAKETKKEIITQNTSETKGKNAHYAMMLTNCRTNDVSIRKKEYFRIEAAKQNTTRLRGFMSKATPLRRGNSKDMGPSSRPQQRSQSVNVSFQAQNPKPSASTIGKRGKSSSNCKRLR